MKHWAHWGFPSISTGVRIATLFVGMQVAMAGAAETKVDVTFAGGHDTDKKDGGRPVVLIAAALDVKPEVFRKAFSGVTPSRNGPPTQEEARKNKAALMKVLKPLGVTNERLDEVSNYYRYRPQRGELWTNSPAKAHAVVENGKIKKLVITDPGSGYSSEPTVTVAGFEKVEFIVTVHFDKDLKKNGSIDTLKVAKP
ncbi:MAG: hypothetical protein JWN70_4334 [Planctomycetaceae bacterium]|nr:hypothetical protein [Planctomycetaceae bacterium]